jgi:hypothetical protein
VAPAPPQKCLGCKGIGGYLKGNGYISQPAINDRSTKLPSRNKKYFARSLVPSFAIKEKTSETRMLKINIRVK